MSRNLVEWGSQTAKNGFKNEDEIVDKFNAWKTDTDAQKWLVIMNYSLEEIEYVEAIKLARFKTDVNVIIKIKLKKARDCENIQVKLVSNSRGFNQVDKRRLANYKNMWNIPEDIYKLMEYFTGERLPYKKSMKENRMFLTEFDETELSKLLLWIDNNKFLIASDILKGRGKFCAEWILVAQKVEQNARWTLVNINEAINLFLGNGKVTISPRGSLYIGHITMQRKGGDGGRDSAKMLQFKIDPTKLFELKPIEIDI